jgi:hypothetical protein
MSAQHTPGPLHVTREVDADGEAQHTVRAATGSPLAVLSNYATREQKANAHLYAAAPELLAALRLCNARLLARMHTDSGDDCEAYSAARAAITKTEPA